MWDEMALCTHCQNIIGRAKFNTPFFTPICPYCSATNTFETVFAKETWTAVWYKPWTWFDTKWVVFGRKTIDPLDRLKQLEDLNEQMKAGYEELRKDMNAWISTMTKR